jgi:hypothetical protein
MCALVAQTAETSKKTRIFLTNFNHFFSLNVFLPYLYLPTHFTKEQLLFRQFNCWVSYQKIDFLCRAWKESFVQAPNHIAMKPQAVKVDVPLAKKQSPFNIKNFEFWHCSKRDPVAERDEISKKLNLIAARYPFCVVYKTRNNDPL